MDGRLSHTFNGQPDVVMPVGGAGELVGAITEDTPVKVNRYDFSAYNMDSTVNFSTSAISLVGLVPTNCS